MGKGSSTMSQDTILEQSTMYKTQLTKATEIVNKIATSVINKQMTTASSGTLINQNVTIGKITSDSGDINITDTQMKADATIDMSMLSDATQKDALVQDLTQNIKDQIALVAGATQDQLNSDGEQIFSEIGKDVSDVLTSLGASVTGSDASSSRDTSISEHMGLDIGTTLNNRVEESVSTTKVSETVSDLQTTLVANQNYTLQGAESKSGNINIAGINMDFMSKTTSDVVTTSGLSTDIVQKFTGLQVTQVKQELTTEQKQTEEKASTLQDVEQIEKTGLEGADALSKTWTSALMMPLILGIVGLIILIGLGMYLFKKPLSAAIESKAGAMQVGSGRHRPEHASFSSYSYQNASPRKRQHIEVFFWTLSAITVVIIYLVVKKRESYSPRHQLMRIRGRWLHIFEKGGMELVADKKNASKIVMKLEGNEMKIYKTQGSNNIYLKYHETDHEFLFDGDKGEATTTLSKCYDRATDQYCIRYRDNFLSSSVENSKIQLYAGRERDSVWVKFVNF